MRIGKNYKRLYPEVRRSGLLLGSILEVLISMEVGLCSLSVLITDRLIVGYRKAVPNGIWYIIWIQRGVAALDAKLWIVYKSQG